MPQILDSEGRLVDKIVPPTRIQKLRQALYDTRAGCPLHAVHREDLLSVLDEFEAKSAFTTILTNEGSVGDRPASEAGTAEPEPAAEAPKRKRK